MSDRNTLSRIRNLLHRHETQPDKNPPGLTLAAVERELRKPEPEGRATEAARTALRALERAAQLDEDDASDDDILNALSEARDALREAVGPEPDRVTLHTFRVTADIAMPGGSPEQAEQRVRKALSEGIVGFDITLLGAQSEPNLSEADSEKP